MSNVFYIGATDPEAVKVTVTPDTTGIDLTTVTAATLKVKPPSGAVMTWAVAMTNVTSSSMQLTHVFETDDSAAGAGRYAVVAELTIGGKVHRCLMAPLIGADIYKG